MLAYCINIVGSIVTGLAGVVVTVFLVCSVMDWVADRIAKTTGIYDAVVRTIWKRAQDKQRRKYTDHD